ncbi:hypothetical protein DMC30DRAFT_449616 [Rhodotorula diobovata]|uniref:Postreplication repair E3 ubiquitin-protein ligase RAD18 n=1 Tax=Rhodotorula diobovata TaxID=5288 RepID=A0A5C5FP20_9BASI|nr:hypothetical protein DMC30DRAFT_449616 [Rhodotorula diobovata]
MATGRVKKRVKRTPATPGDLSLAAQLDTASDYSDPSLVSVDHSLRCAICTELLTAPVILSTCSHSFDSYCLRTYLVTHKRCPSCLRECSEANIHLNLALQVVVAAWKDARPTLLRLQSLAASTAPTAGPSPPPPATPPPAATPSAASQGKRKASALAASSSSSSPAVKPEPRDSDAAPLLIDDGSLNVEIIEDGSTARASASRRPPPKKKSKGADGRETRAGEGKGKGRAKDLEDADPTDPSLILECPLCGGSIKNALMALHVERCNGVAPPPPTQSTAAWGRLLGTGGRAGAKDDDSDSSQSDTRGSSKLDTTRHLPLASYAHKSVPELNEMLKANPPAYGLPTTLPTPSSRDPLTTEAKLALLTRRHRQFLVLWNANADLAADDPAHLNAQGVRDKLKKWEKTRDRQSGTGGAAAGGGTAGTAGSGVGPSGEWSTKAHLRKYKDNFRELVAQARASYEAAKQLQQAKADNKEPPEQDQQEEQAQEPVTAPPAHGPHRQPLDLFDKAHGPPTLAEHMDSLDDTGRLSLAEDLAHACAVRLQEQVKELGKEGKEMATRAAAILKEFDDLFPLTFPALTANYLARCTTRHRIRLAADSRVHN